MEGGNHQLPPSWEDAMTARRQKQFTKPERKNGRPTGQRVRFEMNASIDSISAESAGLGFFLRFNLLLWRLLILMCILSLYPLIANCVSRASKGVRSPTPTFTLVADANNTKTKDTIPASMFVEQYAAFRGTPAQFISDSWTTFTKATWGQNFTDLYHCQKPPVSNVIIATSAGSVCSADTASVGCTNVCLVQPWCALVSRLRCAHAGENPLDPGNMQYCPRPREGGPSLALGPRAQTSMATLSRKLRFASNEVNATEMWFRVLQYGARSSADWNTFFDSTCRCCDLEYSKEREEVTDESNGILTSEQVPIGLPDLPLGHVFIWFLVILLYLGWLIYYEAVERKCFARIDAKTITAADYSAWVTGLDRNSCDSNALIAFARHYGEVVAAFHVPLLGPTLSGCRKIHEANILLAELEALKEGVPCRIKEGRTHCGVVDAVGAWCISLYLCMLRSPAAAVEKQKEEIRKLEEKLLLDQRGEFAPSGAGIIIFNYERHVKNFLRNQRYTKHFLFTAFTAHVSRNSVVARKAPLPRNVFWENGCAAGGWVIGRRLLSWFIFAAVLTLFGYCQVLLYRRAQDELFVRLNSEAQGSQTSFVERGKAFVRSNVWALGQALAVTVFNFIGYHLSIFTTAFEKHLVASHHIRSHTVKLTLFYLINSMILPLSSSVRANRFLWYQVGGLVQSLFFIQVLDALVPVFAYLWEPLNIWLYFILSRYARSQVFLNWCLEPREFDLPYRYASLLKTVGLALLYFPLLPISPIIAFGGVVFSYYVDRYMALRVDAKPKDLDRDVRLAFTAILYGLAVMQILVLTIYFPNTFGNDSPYVAMIYVCAILWLLLFFGRLVFRPAKAAYQRWRKGVLPQGDAGRTLSFWDTVGDASPALIYQTLHRPGFIADEYTSRDSTGKKMLYYHDYYTPLPLEVPDLLTDEYRARVREHVRPFSHVVAPDLRLHTGQLEEYGGVATNNPGNTVRMTGPGAHADPYHLDPYYAQHAAAAPHYAHHVAPPRRALPPRAPTTAAGRVGQGLRSLAGGLRATMRPSQGRGEGEASAPEFAPVVELTPSSTDLPNGVAAPLEADCGSPDCLSPENVDSALLTENASHKLPPPDGW